MKAIFRNATRYLSPDDIVTSRVAPFGHFEAADMLETFYQTLTAQQAREKNPILGGFAYGGAFADLGMGRTPKDYDLYIASPRMVARLKDFLSGGMADDDYMNEGEWAEAAWGSYFPIAPHTDHPGLCHTDMTGEYFEFTGRARVGGEYRQIDIKIGTLNPDLKDFLSFTPAPIMAAGMALGNNEPTYAYHRDCADHAHRGILCTVKQDASNMIEKARRKGLELITPSALAERDRAAPAPAVQREAAYQPVI